LKLVILGPPGSGKGTQAQAVSSRLGIPAISTGQTIRSELKNGKQAELCKSGKFLPDNIVIEIVKNRLKNSDCKNGFILDGFPRTIVQAESLETFENIDKVLDLEVPDEIIIERITGRRVCKKCGATYHLVYNPPNLQEVCNFCSGNLIKRDDDNLKTVKERLRIYHEQTEPLKEFYKNKNLLLEIDGKNGVEETKKMTFLALGV